MAYKLHSEEGNFRSFKALIAAEYCGVNVEVVVATAPPKDAPFKKLPVLEVVDSSSKICNSNAIARFIGKLNAGSELLGATVLDSAKVDQWMSFCETDIELPATLWFYPVLGFIPHNPAIVGKARGDLSKALAVLNNHLADKTYMVGDKITLADIAIVSALVYPFKFVCDPKYRDGYKHVMRWFNTCVNQPNFSSVIGSVTLATKENTPSGVAAPPSKEEKKKKAPKETKPKEKKEEKKKEEPKDEEPAPAKKAEHPFKIMDREKPTPFVMDTWKKTYSNCSDYKTAMDTFYETFDSEGWSIWRGDYKYNDENKVLFMTSNLIGGFMQRTDEIRKWLFGTCTIRGTEGAEMKVTHHFLIRGHSIQPLLDCNDDASCYDWTQVETPLSEATKKQLYDYWCSDGPLDGEAMLDSRLFK